MRFRKTDSVLGRFAQLSVVCFAAAYLFLALANVPVLGIDSHLVLEWSHSFLRASVSLFYPRWIDEAFGGFGAPVFYYYPPLPFFVGNIFASMAGISSANANFHAVQLTGSGIAFLAMWRLLTYFEAQRNRKVLGSLLFSFSFYGYLDIYLRAARGEAFAMSVLPLGLLGLLLILDRRNPFKGLTYLALSFGVLLLSNIPVAILFFFAACFLTVFRKPGFKELKFLCGAFSLGSGLAAAYVLPLFWFRTEIAPGDSAAIIFPAFNFLTVNHSPLFAVAFLLLLGAVGLFAALSRDTQSKLRPYRWAIFVVILLQIPALAFPVWKYVPLFDLVQSSLRLNVLFMVLLAAAFGLPLAPAARRMLDGVVIVLTLSVLGATLPYLLRSFDYERNDGNEHQYGAYEYFTRNRSITPDSSQRFVLAHQADPEIDVIRGESVNLKAARERTNSTQVSVTSTGPTLLRFHRFYFPTWSLREASGRSIPIGHDAEGRIIATLPAGQFSGALTIETHPVEQAGAWISALSAFALILLGVNHWRENRGPTGAKKAPLNLPK